jgi:hypothetical protein
MNQKKKMPRKPSEKVEILCFVIAVTGEQHSMR